MEFGGKEDPNPGEENSKFFGEKKGKLWIFRDPKFVEFGGKGGSQSLRREIPILGEKRENPDFGGV